MANITKIQLNTGIFDVKDAGALQSYQNKNDIINSDLKNGEFACDMSENLNYYISSEKPSEGIFFELNSGLFAIQYQYPVNYLHCFKNISELKSANILINEFAKNMETNESYYITDTEPSKPHIVLDNGLFGVLYDYANKTYVNVKDFGAVGNARYYNINSKLYYQDIMYTIRPTSDVDAINSAIAYALQNGIDTVYFPTGFYYLPNWSYELDVDKLRFVGGEKTALVSEGLSSGSFLTLISTVGLDGYNSVKSPISNIALWGSYFTNSAVMNVIGLNVTVPARVLIAHAIFENITVKDFNVGFSMNQAYKSTWFNCSAIACDFGVNFLSGSAIPLLWIGGYIECCYIGLYGSGSGWENVVFNGVAFEYNRVQVQTSTNFTFYGCRFEHDPLSIPDSIAFNLSGNLYRFTNCDFLLLPNYPGNVSGWVPNPGQYEGTIVNANLIYCPNVVMMTNCRGGIDTKIKWKEGMYVLASKFYSVNTQFGSGGNSLVDPNNMLPVTSTFL